MDNELPRVGQSHEKGCPIFLPCHALFLIWTRHPYGLNKQRLYRYQYETIKLTLKNRKQNFQAVKGGPRSPRRKRNDQKYGTYHCKCDWSGSRYIGYKKRDSKLTNVEPKTFGQHKRRVAKRSRRNIKEQRRSALIKDKSDNITIGELLTINFFTISNI